MTTIRRSPKLLSSLLLVALAGCGGGGGGSGSGGGGGNSSAAPGSLVVFTSFATNLGTAVDDGTQSDVFLKNRETGEVTLISVDADGNDTAGSPANQPSISSNGRYVAFASSDQLVPGDDNGNLDVFVRDLRNGTNKRVSIASDGSTPGGVGLDVAISGNGQVVAFTTGLISLHPSDTNFASDVYVRDLQTNTTELISVDADGNVASEISSRPALSDDGRYVAFDSQGNLSALDADPDEGNHLDGYDVYLRDRQTGTTTLVSINSAGDGVGNGNSTHPSISADGRYVAFQSLATNLVTIPDENGSMDVFVRDMQTGTTELISVNADGDAAANDIGGAESMNPSISPDGRYVAFQSNANNIVTGYGDNGATHIYVRDRQNGTTAIVSLSDTGMLASASSLNPKFSSDGRYIVFGSDADDLDGQANNGQQDIFVYDLETGTIERISVNDADENANNASFVGDIN